MDAPGTGAARGIPSCLLSRTLPPVLFGGKRTILRVPSSTMNQQISM